MRIVLRDKYGHDVLTWVVPDDFVDLGRCSQVSTSLDDRYGMNRVVLMRDTDAAPLDTGTNPAT